jgi:hypothetical protein
LPGLSVHSYIDRLFFGKSYWRIHRRMDGPVATLGKNHRILYHDPPTACAIARSLYPSDPIAERAAVYHIIVDHLCSQNPSLKRSLERLAKSRGKKKRRKIEAHARKTRKDPKEKVIAELQRLMIWKILTS